MQTITVTRNCLGRAITMTGVALGQDIQICLYGGDKPHIGGLAMALPYESHGKPSASISSLSVPQHKDEIVCRAAAKRIAVTLNRTVVATGGIHYDAATSHDISLVNAAIDEMADELARQLKHSLQQNKR